MSNPDYKPSPWEEPEAYFLTEEQANDLLTDLRDRIRLLYEFTDDVGKIAKFLEEIGRKETRNWEQASKALWQLREAQTSIREMLRLFGLPMPK